MPRTFLLIGLPLCAAAAVAWFALHDDGAPADAAVLAEVASDEGASTATPAAPARPRAAAETSGYSGTADVRRGPRVRAAAPPPSMPPRGLDRDRAWRSSASGYFADDAHLAALAAEIPRQTSYPDILRLLHRLGGEPEDGSVTDRHEDGTRRRSTRFQRDPARMAALLDDALAASQRGVVRQALIFHMALALPPEFALPRLRALAGSADPDDAEDAVCALAFTGDEAALSRFEDLSQTPTRCAGEVRVESDHDEAKLFRDGRRDVLRSYRSIDVLDRSPYFHIHGLWMDDVGRPFPWADAPEDTARPAALVGRALPAWLRRYPGHAGSDDMAYRLARLRAQEGRDLEALRWASLGASVPDGDMRDACLGLVVSIVEFAPQGSAAVEDVIDPAAADRNRDLLVYLRLRRHAQDLGWKAGVREAADVASAEPRLVIARAWRDRWAAPVPRGLDSGLAPLPADDPLRRVETPRSEALPEPTDAPAWWDHGGGAPWLRADALRDQFRAWETMATLEERRAAARGSAAIDLLYKEAAVHFHDRDVLYPAYATHDESYSGRPSSWRLGTPRATETAWLRGVLSWDLAARGFEEIARLDPQHALADDAVYSAALAHVKAADDRAVRDVGDAERERHLRAAVAAFQDLLTRWPQSPYAASADAALRYWRKARPDVF